MRSRQTIGVPDPGPGKCADQSCVLESSLSGKLLDRLDPFRCGPRHWGQSSARAKEIDSTIVNNPAGTWFFMVEIMGD